MRRISSAVLAAFLAAGVGACGVTGTTPETGLWQFRRTPDPITGADAVRAFIVSSKATPKPQHFASSTAGVQLQCFKHEPVVQIRFEFKVGSTRSAALSYRFDTRPGHDADVRIMQDFRTIVIEDKAAVQTFVEELRTAKQLLVRVNSLVAGDAQAEFPVEGAAGVIDTVYADCPLGGKKPDRRVARDQEKS